MPSANFCHTNPSDPACIAETCAANPSDPVCHPGGGGCDPATDPNCGGDDGDWCTDHPDSVVCQTPHAGGGTGCGAQPPCDGDPVGCAQLNMQWQLKCQAEDRQEARHAEAAGDCNTVPTCAGDPIDCAVYAQLHKVECVGKSTIEPGTGDACDHPVVCTSGDEAQCMMTRYLQHLDCNSTTDFDPNDPGNTEPDISGLTPAAITTNGGDMTSGFDATGFIGGGACPEFAPINVMGMSLNFNSDAFCSVMSLIGALVLAGAYFKAARVVLGP
jgi:hypothetical protein